MQPHGKKSRLGAFFLSALCLIAGRTIAADKDSSATAPLLEQAARAEFRGDYSAAFKFYSQATRKNPSDAEAWAAFGEHLRFYAHDYKAAEAAFKKALDAPQKNPRASAFAWRGLGELAAKSNHDEEAVAYFEKSLEAMPIADTHRSLCHLYCRQKKFNEAAEHARAAVKLNPDDPIAVLLFAAQLHRAGDPSEGRKQFQTALSLSGMDENGKSDGPVHCCVFYNAAGYLAVAGNNAGAMNMLDRFFNTPNHRHLTREEIESDADFEALKSLPEFQKLLESNL